MVGWGFRGKSEVIMKAFPSWWRGRLAAVAMIAGILGLSTACGGGGKHGSDDYVQVSGHVTYTRKPMYVDGDGVPRGVQNDSAQFTTQGARGVKVRLIQAREETAPDNSKVLVWYVASDTTTDSNGNYSFASATKGEPAFVELSSAAIAPNSPNSVVQLIGDPAGIESSVPEPDRVIYCQRKRLDGAFLTLPSAAVPAVSEKATVDFAVGLDDPWLLAPISWIANAPYTAPSTTPAGSRVLAILDSIYGFSSSFGNPVPASASAKSVMDLHYRPGLGHPRGSFVEYDLNRYPLSFDGSSSRYFGTLSGRNQEGDGDGDAFDEGIIHPLLARNNLFSQGRTRLLPVSRPLASLSPDLAVVEGLGDAMAASLLKRPYLANPEEPDRYAHPRDIRKVDDAAKSAFSAPALSALTWDMVLRVNGIAGSTLASDWSKIDCTRLNRFYGLVNPTETSGNATVVKDLVTIHSQAARLQEGKSSSDSLDLASYFPDSVLTPLLQGYGIAWTSSSTLPVYAQSWGKDPDSLTGALPAFTLSMTKAEMVRGLFPNCSEGEVVYRRFALTYDRAYQVSLANLESLAGDASVEVVFDEATDAPLVFSASQRDPQRVVLRGNYSDTTTPTWHWVRIRILSPATRQPDFSTALVLNKAN
jgi:hypothetical protein